MEPTEGGFVKSPNWSLGNYSRSIVVRKNGDFLNDSAPIIKVSFYLLYIQLTPLRNNYDIISIQVIDFFIDGQRCDETNRGRNTEVHIQCCEGLPNLHNYIPVSHFASHLHSLLRSPHHPDTSTTNPILPPATLNAIVETEVCSYKATVCTPLLCAPLPDRLG